MSVVRRVSVGRLASAFGVRGEIMFVPAPFAAVAVTAGRTYALGAGSQARTLRCTSVRTHHAKLLISFEDFTSPEAVRELAGSELFADDHDIVLAPGEYLDTDLVGLQLVDAAGKALGAVVGVQHFPAQDCLVVGAQRALVPMIAAFVGTIDLGARTIATTLPEGLLE